MREVSAPGFFFALPRLLSGARRRTEKSWIEANLVGVFVHLLAYLYAHQIFLGNSTVTQQLLWAIPLAFLVWIWWMLVLYLNSLGIKFLRALGLIRTLPDRYAQSFMIEIVVTLFACDLAITATWRPPVGWSSPTCVWWSRSRASTSATACRTAT